MTGGNMFKLIRIMILTAFCLASCMICYLYGRQEVRKEAIRNGVASFVTNPKTGQTTFQWGVYPIDVETIHDIMDYTQKRIAITIAEKMMEDLRRNTGESTNSPSISISY